MGLQRFFCCLNCAECLKLGKDTLPVIKNENIQQTYKWRLAEVVWSGPFPASYVLRRNTLLCLCIWGATGGAEAWNCLGCCHCPCLESRQRHACALAHTLIYITSIKKRFTHSTWKITFFYSKELQFQIKNMFQLCFNKSLKSCTSSCRRKFTLQCVSLSSAR